MREELFIGQRVFVKHTEGGRTIADTSVIRYDDRTRSIFIPADSLQDRDCKDVYVGVLVDNGFIEFQGSIRKSRREDEVRISLTKPKLVNHRAAQRYEISSDGELTHISAAGHQIRLNKSIPIHLKNMSSSGVLISTDPGALSVGREFQATLEIDPDSRVNAVCQVVRIQVPDLSRDEYGCRILRMWKAGTEE